MSCARILQSAAPVLGFSALLQPARGDEPKPKAILTGYQGWVNEADFSPDGKSLVSVGDDKTVHLWNLATAKQRLDLRHTKELYSAAYSPDGKLQAVAGKERWITL